MNMHQLISKACCQAHPALLTAPCNFPLTLTLRRGASDFEVAAPFGANRAAAFLRGATTFLLALATVPLPPREVVCVRELRAVPALAINCLPDFLVLLEVSFGLFSGEDASRKDTVNPRELEIPVGETPSLDNTFLPLLRGPQLTFPTSPRTSSKLTLFTPPDLEADEALRLADFRAEGDTGCDLAPLATISRNLSSIQPSSSSRRRLGKTSLSARCTAFSICCAIVLSCALSSSPPLSVPYPYWEYAGERSAPSAAEDDR